MPTTRYGTGAPNWIDLGTPDIEGAAAFYHHLFGRRFRSAGPDMGGYGFFQLDSRTAAAGTQNPPEQSPPSWSGRVGLSVSAVGLRRRCRARCPARMPEHRSVCRHLMNPLNS